MSAPESSAIRTSSPAAGRSTPSTSTAYSASGAMTSTSADVSAASTYNGEGESSKLVDAGPDPTAHAINLASYIFNVGYLAQNWTDVRLAFFGEAIQLHRIILSRCPWLSRFLMGSPPGGTIHLSFNDENITKDGVHICIQHLYNPAQHLVNASNARSVLATAVLFDGMPELAEHAYGVLAASVSEENAVQYVQWLQAPPNDGFGTMYGSVMVNGQEAAAWDEDSPGRYGEWSKRLKRDVVEFLLHSFPDHLAQTSSTLSSDPRLLSLYSALPFELFKRCVESPDLAIQSKQDRFAFAKKVIAQRKKAVAATGMEEIAVLAFKGGDDGMEVHVTRKPKRKTALLKVEG